MVIQVQKAVKTPKQQDQEKKTLQGILQLKH
jgi:hypothetical protein